MLGILGDWPCTAWAEGILEVRICCGWGLSLSLSCEDHSSSRLVETHQGGAVILTNYDICFRAFFFQEIGGIIVALHDPNFGELGRDLLALFGRAYNSRVFVIWVFVVELKESITTDVPGGSCAMALVSSFEFL